MVVHTDVTHMDQIWVWGTQIYNVWFRKGLGSTWVTLKFLNLKFSSENLKNLKWVLSTYNHEP